ncbi:BMP family lipoprotein [Vagococcus acidifermentans]|uniref:BMP family ABC transporter substrate-binding protein n=1 Tax=Vagococcus acidifermentans TaxID=564710 RepID=A0A430B272_9ENTE|nr:BMP family protein [Vagococcus acidifermentans]RSU14437.1 BMP family ABC transporter substrate-binding protein [Vagococcus acidifermentans]
MKKRTFLKTGLVLALGLVLTACGGGGGDTKESGDKSGKETSDFSAALVTDLGGVDDKSFNQSAWEGLKEWGEATGREEGVGGFKYYQSDSDADFLPNLNSAIDDGFNIVFGIGFKLQPAIEEVAKANEDVEFVIIDSEVKDQKNVASVLFKDHEASYLAGIAAAKATKTGKVGFIGGQEGEVIGRFEAGFVAGVKSVDEKMEVDVKYAGSFGDAAKGKAIAAAMYQSGIDVIFHASGDTGQGVFSEAIDIMNTNPEDKVWVIGVDRDQEEEGVYNNGNVTLTSTLKGVGTAVKDISEKSEKGEFPGGDLMVYGLKEGGVDLTDGQLDDVNKDIKPAIDEAREAIIAGEIEVPDKP